MLAIASVIGREFRLPTLERVSGRGATSCSERWRRSVHARLIEEQEAVGHYRFSHALVRETLYEELRTARRVRLHGQVGAALERIHTRDLDAHAAELAYHYAEAAPAGFAEQAVAYASQAAERAMTRFAWESAIEQYQLALQMLDLLDEPEPHQEIELLLMLGEAQERMATGRPHTGRYGVGAGGSPSALATFRHAVELARKAGTPEQFAHAALGVVGFNPLPQLGGIEGMRFLEEALERLPADDSPLRVRLLARLGADPYVVVSSNETSLPTELGDQLRARCDAAIAMARRLGDPASLAYALIMSGQQSELRTDDEWLAIADEAVEVATAAAERPLLVWALGSKLSALERRGDIAAQRGVMDHLARVAAELRVPFVLWVVAAAEASAALATGHLAEAERYLDQADQIQPQSAWGTNVRIALRREQGRGEELHDLVAVIGPWNSPWEHVLRLVCQLETGHIDAAREGLDALAAEAIAYEGIGATPACLAGRGLCRPGQRRACGALLRHAPALRRQECSFQRQHRHCWLHLLLSRAARDDDEALGYGRAAFRRGAGEERGMGLSAARRLHPVRLGGDADQTPQVERSRASRCVARPGPRLGRRTGPGAAAAPDRCARRAPRPIGRGAPCRVVAARG